jgi:hypothetical protein
MSKSFQLLSVALPVGLLAALDARAATMLAGGAEPAAEAGEVGATVLRNAAPAKAVSARNRMGVFSKELGLIPSLFRLPWHIRIQ